MLVNRIEIEDFIKNAPHSIVFDVRSPKEFQQAHYKDAISLPLFSNEERAEVGTIYKRQSREAAIKRGLDFYGPKMKSMINEVEAVLKDSDKTNIIVHCWRGGMRSAAVAWLLDLYGFKVSTLEGGYKKFRNWALAQFEKKYDLLLLGGFTGSGKTEILKEFEKKGELVVDLEGLAKHKGSAFGNLDSHHQDSTEQFENNLALKLYKLQNRAKPHQKIWIESESTRIGNVRIPHLFFNQMKSAERVNIKIPFEERLDFIVNGYGRFDNAAMIAATHRIEKRLGGLNMKKTIQFIEENKLKEAFAILLEYYDKAYTKSAQKFESPHDIIHLPTVDPEKNAQHILEVLKL